MSESPNSAPAAFEPLPSSFRDPHGYITKSEGQFLRVLTPQYKTHYEHLRTSGLYDELVASGLLLPHEELADSPTAVRHKVLRPLQLRFVSYPYEWCFSQLRDAALATLQIQEAAIQHGMTLKDASAYNIQFVAGRPTLIDLASFEILQPTPWTAYAQFCRHFLAPLALMSYRDGRLGHILRNHIDGLPLDLARKLLPRRSLLKPSLLLHLHAHAASERWLQQPGDGPKKAAGKFSRESLLGLVQTLRGCIEGLKYRPRRDVWANYYGQTVTGGGYVARKQTVVKEWLEKLRPGTVWDLGANTGLFSGIAAEAGSETIAFDGDVDCVELSYRKVRDERLQRILPLYLDLANPTPALGWEHRERMSWLDRGQPETVLALAVVHHLALANNVPLRRLAIFFARFSPQLIIEFVPKNDPNAQKLLRVREDIFSDYSQGSFESEFRRWFTFERVEPMENSDRMLYWMRRERLPTE